MPIDPRRILFEDDHLLVVNKLAGELAVAAEGEGKLPLFDFLKKDYPGLRVVHRLDYQTSGILVFAKTAAAVEKIRRTKFEGWEKTYIALLAGRLERTSGTITLKLKARTHEGLVDAVTHYRVLHQFAEAAEVEAVIDTGRKHQIRQHFASIGHPLLRDPLYGNLKADASFQSRYGYSRFFLHAAKLRFPHPITGGKLQVSCPLPKSFADVLHRLSLSPVVHTKAKPLFQKKKLTKKKFHQQKSKVLRQQKRRDDEPKKGGGRRMRRRR